MGSPFDTIDEEVVGVVLMKGTYVHFTMNLLIRGIQLFMCIYGLCAHLNNPPERRRGRLPYIGASLSIFILYGVRTALDISHLFGILFKATSAKTFWRGLSRESESWNRIFMLVCVVLYLAIGDGILVYRCYTFWRHKWWFCIPLFTLYLTSIVLGLTTGMPYMNTIDQQQAYSAQIFALVAVNIVATSMIVTVLVQGNRRINRVLPSSYTTVYTHVAAMVIESALAPAIFGLALAINTVVPLPGTNHGMSAVLALNSTFDFLFHSSATLAPMAIVFRVTVTSRSWARDPSEMTSNQTRSANPIRFASTQMTAQSSNKDTINNEENGDSDYDLSLPQRASSGSKALYMGAA